MHPPLDRPHPSCEEFVTAIRACHANNVYAKFWGACNEPKALMDRCFREEKEQLRSANLKKARAFDREHMNTEKDFAAFREKERAAELEAAKAK